MAAVLSASASASAQRARWRRPVVLAGPVATDLLPAGLAVSPAGAVAVGFDLSEPDQQPAATAQIVAFGGGAPPVDGRIPGEQQVLAAAYAGPDLTVLTGSTPAAAALGCCSSVETETLAPGAPLPAEPSPLAGPLNGPTDGQLIAAGRTLIALVGNSSGVWAAPSAIGGFGPVSQLAGPSASAPLIAGATLGGGWLAAWSPGSPTAGVSTPLSQVQYVIGQLGQPVQAARTAVTVAPGHSIDQLEVVPDPPSATFAFTQSWYDRRGGFHSRIEVKELGARRAVALSPADQLATGLSLASGPGDYQVLTWESCSQTTYRCLAQARLRSPAGAWSPPLALGAIDATATPVAIETADDTAIVGRIAYGTVWASTAPAGASRFDPALQLSTTGGAASLTLAAGPRGTAVAAWTTGIATQSLLAAGYQP